MKRYKVVHKIMHSEVFYIDANSETEAEEISMSGEVECDKVIADETVEDVFVTEEENENV